MLLLPRLFFLRALTGLAIAIASPAVEVGHGLAHEHAYQHEQGVSHHDEDIVSALDHSAEHPHERISEALRNRGDVSELVLLPAIEIVADPPAARASPPMPVPDDGPSEDRATGPPPSLRAPPIA